MCAFDEIPTLISSPEINITFFSLVERWGVGGG